MSNLPDTRYSLLFRISDSRDSSAWLEFWQLYEPVIYRMARRFGLQDADACDLTQDVLAAINKAIRDWKPDRERGRFRTWLHAVVRNKTISGMRRLHPGDRGTGDSEMIRRLESHPIACEAPFEIEVRRSAFQRAAELVKEEVQVSTWEAFWRTSVLGQSIEQTAQELNVSIGSVYAARSRVLARLRREVGATLPADIET